MKIKQENVDKIVKTIQDIPPVYGDVKKALDDDDHVSLLEGGVIAIKHSGKVLSLITSIKEIGEELVDLDPAEAEEVMNEIAAIAGEGNSEIEQGSKEIVMGMAYIRTGSVRIIEAREAAKAAETDEEQETKSEE